MGRSAMWPRICEHCGEDFLGRATEIRRGFGRFCSRSCRSVEGGRALRRKYSLKHRAKNPELASQAHKAVEKAVKEGELQRMPCCVCGTDENPCAHHEDYALPLEVVWYCSSHHTQYHRGLVELS